MLVVFLSVFGMVLGLSPASKGGSRLNRWRLLADASAGRGAAGRQDRGDEEGLVADLLSETATEEALLHDKQLI